MTDDRMCERILSIQRLNINYTQKLYIHILLYLLTLLYYIILEHHGLSNLYICILRNSKYVVINVGIIYYVCGRSDMVERLLLEQTEAIKHAKESEELAQANLLKLQKVTFFKCKLSFRM